MRDRGREKGRTTWARSEPWSEVSARVVRRGLALALVLALALEPRSQMSAWTEPECDLRHRFLRSASVLASSRGGSIEEGMSMPGSMTNSPRRLSSLLESVRKLVGLVLKGGGGRVLVLALLLGSVDGE